MVLEKNNEVKILGKDDIIDEEKRKFLKLVVIASVGISAGSFLPSLSYLISPSIGLTSFPTLKLVDQSGNPIKASQIPPLSPKIILFNYPLLNEPNFLINMNKSVKNGVGPNNNIVAFSAICQHLGCEPPSIRFIPNGQPINGITNYIFCDCHGSHYDPSNAGAILTGPTTRPLPQVILNYDSQTDELYAIKMTGPAIYKYNITNFNDISQDLVGGSPPNDHVSTVYTLSE